MDLIFTRRFRQIPYGLVVRIRRSHRRGPGSIPGVGTTNFFFNFSSPEFFFLSFGYLFTRSLFRASPLIFLKRCFSLWTKNPLFYVLWFSRPGCHGQTLWAEKCRHCTCVSKLTSKYLCWLKILWNLSLLPRIDANHVWKLDSARWVHAIRAPLTIRASSRSWAPEELCSKEV